jgi:predicted dehydrogenase
VTVGEQVGVGFVGCGGIAHLHSSALREVARGGLPVVAVAAADPVADHRRAVARNFRFARFYDTADELLADPEVDAVWVGVPTHLHASTYEAVLAAGKHLYAEKPIAPDLATVRRLTELATAAPVTTQVGFQARFDPMLLRARDLVRSGEIGPTMSYLWRDDEGFPTASVGDTTSAWRSDRAAAGGGVLLEHSIHALDVVQWFFGPVARVTASSRRVLGFDVEDTVAVLLEHTSGVVGTHVGVYGGVVGREVSRFEIQGRDAIIEIERNGTVVEAPDNTFLLQRSREAPERLDRAQVVREHLERRGIDRAPFLLQDLADRAFVQSILDGEDASPGFADALAAHLVVEAAYRSAAERRPVDLAELA